MKIVITKNVKEYREAAKMLLSTSDHVIEIGCGSGRTTKIIANRARKVLAIDKSREEIRKAEERLAEEKNVILLNEDAFNIRKILSIVRKELGRRVDVVMIDIGGIEDPAKVVDLARRYMAVFKPRLLIVKNIPLAEFISQCIIWNQEKGKVKSWEKQ